MAVLNNTGIRAGASGAGGDAYQVANSLRFNDDDSAYLSRIFGVGNRKTWTWSGWVKRCDHGTEKQGLFGIAGSSVFIRFNNDDGGSGLRIIDSGNYDVITTCKFRDPSAWYHIVVVLDTTENTDTDRIKLYVNGVREEDWYGTPTWPGEDDDETINTSVRHVIGVANTDYYNGSLADVHFVDGTALDASSFGETATTGQWVPKEYTGSYGTNGFYLKFDQTETGATYSDGSNVTADSSGVVNSFILDCVPVSSQFSYYSSTYGPDKLFGQEGDGIYTYYTDTSSGSEYKIDLAALVPGVTITSLKLYIRSGSSVHYTILPWQVSVLDSSKNIIGSAQTVTSTVLAWQTIPVSGSPRYLKFDNIDDDSLRRCVLGGIEINGEVLIDHTAIGYDSSGNKNHWHENNIQIGTAGNVDASGFVVTSGPSSGPNDANIVFDGDTSTMTYAHGHGTHYVHIDTSSDPISCSSTDTLTIYWSTSTTNPRDAELELEFYGGGTTTYSAFTRTSGEQNDTITIGTTGSITDIRFDETSSSNPGELHLRAIKLNDTFLDGGQETDLLADSPATYDDEGNGVGNYATLNPLAKGTNLTLSNGNLDVSSSSHSTVNSTIAVTAGMKVYVELTRTGGSGAGGFGFTSNVAPYSSYPGNGTGRWWVYDNGSNFVYSFNGSDTQYGSKIGVGDCVQLAIDYDAGKAWIGINNTWFTTSNGTNGNPSTGANPTFTFSTSLPLVPLVHSAGYTYSCNFGQRAFEYTPPTDYKALNTFNLDDTEILSGEYEGNGDADGPVVWMNATPATLKIDTSDPPTSLVTFDPDDVDPLSSGFKIRNSSTNNGSGTTYYWLATIDKAFKYANAQTNE